MKLALCAAGRLHSATQALLRQWRHGLRTLGLGQTRCAHCLRPFSPDGEGLLPPAADAGRPAAAHEAHGHVFAEFLCPQCAAALAAYHGRRCPACGLPPRSPQDHVKEGKASLCGHCLKEPPPWQGLAYHGLYQGPLRDCLLRLKFDGALSLLPLLGSCLLEAAACLPRPDVLLAIPQHPAHLRQRGFNQAHELAKTVAGMSGLPLEADFLQRIRHAPPQSSLSGQQRRQNVRKAFTALPDVRGLRIWLIDDVLTTGSTMQAATLALLEAGAAAVHLLAVARTPHKV